MILKPLSLRAPKLVRRNIQLESERAENNRCEGRVEKIPSSRKKFSKIQRKKEKYIRKGCIESFCCYLFLSLSGYHQ